MCECLGSGWYEDAIASRPRFHAWYSKIALAFRALVGFGRLAVLKLLLQPSWRITGRYPEYTRQGILSHDALTQTLRRSGFLQRSPRLLVGGATNAHTSTHSGSEPRITRVDVVPMTPGAVAAVHRVTVIIDDPAAAKGETTTLTFVLKEFGARAQDIIIDALFHFTTFEHRCAKVSAELGLDGLQPACYRFASHWTGMSCALYEDLKGLRAQPSKDPNGCSTADCQSMLRQCGRLHGRTWNNRRIAELLRRPPDPMEHGFPGIVAAAIDHPFAGPLLASLPRLKKTMLLLTDPVVHDALLTVWRGCGKPAVFAFLGGEGSAGGQCPMANPCVLAHGDVRCDNSFFHSAKEHDGGEDAAVFIDWQISMAMHPTRDIGWAIMELGVDALKDDRVLRSVFQAYCDGAASTHYSGVSPVSVDDIVSWIPLMMASNAVYWAIAIRFVLSQDMCKDPTIASTFTLYLQRVEVLLERYGTPTLEDLVRLRSRPTAVA